MGEREGGRTVSKKGKGKEHRTRKGRDWKR